MKLDEHYVNPRLVALYDIENPPGADTDFYIRLAADYEAERIIDLGCGTGLLTRKLAAVGRQVIGVDPAAAMLAYARRQPDADKVQWLEGDAAALGNYDADLVIMTGNVAQIFREDAEWAAVLRAIYNTLKSGGHLAFESRNPHDKAWERWNPEQTWQRMDTPLGSVESWLEVVEVGSRTVCFRGYTRFVDSGEELVADSELRFRSHAELTDSLHKAGFVVKQVWGDWDYRPFANSSRLMIFVAHRP